LRDWLLVLEIRWIRWLSEIWAKGKAVNENVTHNGRFQTETI